MRVTLTGATGLIGSTLVAALVATAPRSPCSRATRSAPTARLGVPAVGWDPLDEPAPAQALEGRDAVVHLAGENVAQRWSASAKRAIRESRVTTGTRHLRGGAERVCLGRRRRAAAAVLVSSSAIGYYGPHGEEPLDEEAPPGGDFLAQVCVAWETEARAAQQLGMRTVQVRTGVVLDPRGGALAKMLPPFRLGVGGPVAGGRQYVSWIHVDDLVGMIACALSDERWSGPVNGTAPEPVTNRELSHALGRALHRPALLPVPGAALRAALRGDGADRHHRRARAAGEAADAGLRVPPPPSRRGAGSGAEPAELSLRAVSWSTR